MTRTILPLLVLLSVSLLPSSLYAQSGRKTAEPKQTKTDPAKTEDNGVVNETPVNPNGETVEGDVIRFDTALVTVPVSASNFASKKTASSRRSPISQLLTRRSVSSY